MKIGNLQFKEYAAKKPITVSPSGEFLTAKDVASESSLSLGSLSALNKESQLKLVLERYRLEPDFKLGMVGVGLMTKKEIIEHIRQQSEFGKRAVQAEVAYCTELMGSLRSRTLPKMPGTPDLLPPKVPDWKNVARAIMVKMKTRAIFCENTTDPVTAPIAAYRIRYVHPIFVKRGFTVIALTGTQDIRPSFVAEATRRLSVYLSGVGHGNQTTYTGHNSDHILEVGHYNPQEVAGKAIHYLSCQTAGQLGPDTVSKGANCYAGYDQNFHFLWDDTNTPIDEFKLFVTADATFDIWMGCGKTAQQAFNAAIQAFNAAIHQVPGTVAATWLTYDRDHFRLLGAAATVILPYRWVRLPLPLRTIEGENALVEAGELVD